MHFSKAPRQYKSKAPSAGANADVPSPVQIHVARREGAAIIGIRMIAGTVTLLAALAAAPAEVRLVTVEEGTIHIRELSLRLENERLIIDFVDAAGGRRSAAAEDVVEIVFDGGRPPRSGRAGPEDLEIHLTTGDRLTGKAGERSPDGIQIRHPVYGDLLLKTEHVRAVLFPLHRASLPRPLPTKVDADTIFLKSGDRAEGILQALSRAGVEYRSARLERDVIAPLTEVAGIWLTEIRPPPRDPETLFAIVFTADGSSMKGRIRSLRDGLLEFSDFYGALHRVGIDHLAGLCLMNGRVVYLSDLQPVSIQEEANYIRGPQKTSGDLEYPFQRDRSAKGTPIILGGVEHRKGIGVRAHSELVYSLNRAFRRFQTAVGLDAAALDLGAVTAEVWIDGRKVREAVFRPAAPPQEWDLDVAGADELKLRVTWAGTGQSDFADWGSARLIR